MPYGRRRTRRRTYSRPHQPLARFPLRGNRTIGSAVEADTHALLTASALNDASVFASSGLDVKSIFLKVAFAGFVAAGTSLVRIIAAIVFADADSTPSFDADSISTGTDARQSFAWGPLTHNIVLGTDEGTGTTGVASIVFKGRPRHQFRWPRSNDSLYLHLQATGADGTALPATSTINAVYDGWLVTSRP